MSSSDAELDIRWPIGLLFTVMGIAVALYGALVRNPAYLPLGVDVNLWWGLAMLVFGLFMVGGAWLAGRRQRQ